MTDINYQANVEITGAACSSDYTLRARHSGLEQQPSPNLLNYSKYLAKVNFVVRVIRESFFRIFTGSYQVFDEEKTMSRYN